MTTYPSESVNNACWVLQMVFRHKRSVDLSSHKEIRPSDLNHDKHGLPLWTAAALLQPSLGADMGSAEGEGFLAQTRS